MYWPFIATPWLALIPAGIFGALYLLTRRALVLAAAIAWAAYAPYEWAMHVRLLCTGECNIRVDLLVFAPALIVLTGVGAGVAARWRGGHR